MMFFPLLFGALNPLLLPTPAHTIATNSEYVCFSEDGNYIFSSSNAASHTTFNVWDITNITSPSLVGIGTCGASTTPAGLWNLGNYLFVCYSHPSANKFAVWDVSNKAVPSLVTTITLSQAGGPWNVLVDGSYAYVVNGSSVNGSNGNHLFVIDISTPTAPVEKGWVSLNNLAYPQGLAKKDNVCYVTTANAYFGMKAVSVAVPTGPTVLGTISLSPWDPRSVACKGDYAYVGGSNAGGSDLKVIDITTPTAMSVANTITVSGNSAYADSVIYGNALYQAKAGGLYTLDLSTPTVPSIVNTDVIAGAISSCDVNLARMLACLNDATGYIHIYTLA